MIDFCDNYLENHRFPVREQAEAAVPYAQATDGLARRRTERSVAAALGEDVGWSDASGLRQALDARREADTADFERMVALQEELDWLSYRLFGLDEAPDLVPPDDVEPCPPTCLPWVLELANHDAEVRAAIGRGEGPGETPTAWFERHGWTPLTELPDTCSPALRARVDSRRAKIREVPELKLIEADPYKRRWYNPVYEAQETEALEAWLADKVEAALEARQAEHAPTAHRGPSGRDFDPARQVQDRIIADAVPNHPTHLFKPSGLTKRAAWEQTWEEQRKEDRGEPANPEVPPKYTQADFLKPTYFRLRGKLDVPKERFIALPGVPGRSSAETLYGWAGWTPVQRIKALLALDEDLEDAGVELADRIGLPDSARRLLPNAPGEDEATAARLKAELQSLVGNTGPSPEQIADWKSRFPPPSASKRGKRKKKD